MSVWRGVSVWGGGCGGVCGCELVCVYVGVCGGVFDCVYMVFIMLSSFSRLQANMQSM